jgi:His-Xaa-Ser system protein HxsD
VTEVVVEFAATSQSVGAIREAAYRMIGFAHTQVELAGDTYICRLTPTKPGTEADLRGRFLDLITDENLREKIAADTDPMRNLIVSLAFGALASAADS